MTVDGQNAVGVFGDDAASFIEAEHTGLVAVLLGAVPDFRLVDSFGKILPHDSRQLDAHANVHLVVAQLDLVAGTPRRKETAAHTTDSKDDFACLAAAVALCTVHLNLHRFTVDIGHLGVGDNVTAGAQLFNQASHRFKVGVGAQMLELCLVHVQVVAQTKFFQLVVWQEALGGRTEGNQNLVSLLDVVNDRLRL